MNDRTKGNNRRHRPFHSLDYEEILTRATKPYSAQPRAFLKWAGSKRLILPALVETLPERFARYYEPFLGGGSLFFLLRPRRAVLGDVCSELIETFKAVRDNPSAVVRYLRPLKPDKSTFYRIRANRSAGRFKRAAEFIYLNKTCWNGLYRVNAAGEFNVPYGLPKTNNVADFENLRACAKVLRQPGVSLRTGDFEGLVAEAARGDLVYLDPPYVTGHSNNAFIDYNEELFSWADQERLAVVAERLRRKGVHVIVSNANHSAVRRLYRHFQIRVISRSSTLASDSSKRRHVKEAILCPRP